MDQEVMDELKEAIAQLLEKEEIHDALPMMKQATNWGDLESQKQLIDISCMESTGSYLIRKTDLRMPGSQL